MTSGLHGKVTEFLLLVSFSTDVWYKLYHCLVGFLPIVGIVGTNHWYLSYQTLKLVGICMLLINNSLVPYPFFPLFVLFQYFQSGIVVPAITVTALIAYFGNVVLLHSVAVAKERTVVFKGVETRPKYGAGIIILRTGNHPVVCPAFAVGEVLTHDTDNLTCLEPRNGSLYGSDNLGRGVWNGHQQQNDVVRLGAAE